MKEVATLDIEEYEELFGSAAREREYREQLDGIIAYATKADEHKAKKVKISKEYRVCLNCKYLQRHWWDYDYYDCAYMKSHRHIEEDDKCKHWEWNQDCIVDPQSHRVVNKYIAYEE